MTERKFIAAILTTVLTFSALVYGCLTQTSEHHPSLGSSRPSCVRKTIADYLKTVDGKCEACGSVSDVEGHHVEPYKKNPARACDPTNIIALCRRHHFELGHAFSFHTYNPNVREDAKRFREMIANRVPNE